MTFVLAETGPTITLAGWYAWLTVMFALVAGTTAVVAFFRKVLIPTADAVAEIHKAIPVLADIAEKFGDSAGRETISSELQALAANQEISAANQRAMMMQLQVVIDRAGALDEKLSDTRHKIIGEFTTLRLAGGTAETLVEAIVRTSDELAHLRDELAALQAVAPPEKEKPK